MLHPVAEAVDVLPPRARLPCPRQAAMTRLPAAQWVDHRSWRESLLV